MIAFQSQFNFNYINATQTTLMTMHNAWALFEYMQTIILMTTLSNGRQLKPLLSVIKFHFEPINQFNILNGIDWWCMRVDNKKSIKQMARYSISNVWCISVWDWDSIINVSGIDEFNSVLSGIVVSNKWSLEESVTYCLSSGCKIWYVICDKQ